MKRHSIWKMGAGYWLLVIGYFVIFVFITNPLYAKEITILYTGETHSMLYPCSCPFEPDGGISRRASLIKQIRKVNANLLVLDSGGFFAGGLLDEYTQNTQLDTQRTKINLKALDIMHYDVLAIGDDEFNFGREFLQDNISAMKAVFLSCNIILPQGSKFNILPYIIREVSGKKIGIIGVTPLSAQQKAGGIKFSEPKPAVKKAVEELEAKGTDIIVLLSRLGEEEDTSIINEISSIDILITRVRQQKEEPFSQVGSSLILRPSWQGRRLGKVTFKIEDKKIKDYKVEELRLSNKIKDDPQALSMLPACFSDANCKRGGFKGACIEPGDARAKCEFSETEKAGLLVITAKDCRACDTEKTISSLKRQLPNLSVSYLYYPDAKSSKLIKELNIQALPAYLLGKEVEKIKLSDSFKQNLEKRQEYFLLNPQYAGIAYFVGRQRINGKLDLFLSLSEPGTDSLLAAVKEFNPEIHFLVVEEAGGFSAKGAHLEVEESLRAVCVNKHYPQYFWDYLACRTKGITSSWWEDCLGNFDSARIKSCARSEEGKTLLKENISLAQELHIMLGPTYLMDNQEIFSSQGAPSKDELKKILKR